MATIEHLNFRGADTRTFAEIFPSDTEFASYYSTCGAPTRLLTGVNADGINYDNYGIEAIYFLLISNYANDHIASYDENRFKLQVMQIIYEAGPAWQKAMGVQEKLMNMSVNDLHRGSQVIHTQVGRWEKENDGNRDSEGSSNGKDIANHALHPDTEPTTAYTEELPYISDQTVNKGNASKEQHDILHDEGFSTADVRNTTTWDKDNVKGYIELLYALDDTLCSRFIYRFKKLFQKIPYNNRPPLVYVEDDYD